ncbi:MAG: YdcH family protein [Proteobacteria bacterium]|nr:YdcH family protein [Pseudomonadota bacterium]
MGLHDKNNALKDKHQALENAIEKEEKRPHPDDIEIVNLKKQKLRIKDQMAAISGT